MPRSFSPLLAPALLCAAGLALGDELVLEDVVTGLRSPVYVTAAGDGSGRLFVVEQAGLIRIVGPDGRLRDRPFLDLTGAVSWGGEKGLLGLAFHPRYADEGRCYVNYTRRRGRRLETVIAEHRVDPDDPDRALPEGRELLVFRQPYGNHNGGHLAFGPDGFLYIAVGDGGAANDPHGHGQDTTTLLGTLLRIDVDGASGERPYGIPPDNPFAQDGGRPEIYAFGLRNPWRFSFDRGAPERLFVGDVGQDRYEEVHLVYRGDNCGWNVMEGLHCFRPPRGCDQEGLRLPISEYSHDEGQSVTGGYVYRGPSIPGLDGVYLFTDFYPSDYWGLRQVDGRWQRVSLGRHRYLVSSFGEGEAGELFVVDYGGRILRVRGVR